MRHSRRLALGVWTAAVVLVAPVLAEDHMVAVSSNIFSPQNLTITVADTVTWTNNGGFHNVQANDGSFRCANGCDGQGGNGAPSTAGWSFTLTFNDPGLIPYFCEIHVGIGMTGTITVEEDGGGGGEPPSTRFNSGFEEPEFADWDDRFCPTCNAVGASIAEGDSLFPQNSGYETDRAGEHWAYLLGPADADFDLFLWWWSGSEWISVASGMSPDAEESVSFDGDAGRYRWEVRSASGDGEFILVFNNPNLAAGATNELTQTEEARKRGQLGLDSAYFTATRNPDYLVDELPVDTPMYKAEFWIKPLEGLTVKGKKHQIFQALQGNKVIVKIFLRAPAAGEEDHRLSVRVRKGNNKFTSAELVTLKTGKFRKIKLAWQAASGPEANDGFFRLRRGKKLLVDIQELDNDAQRINRVRFGQVSKGKKATAGQIYYDNFKSEWEVEGE